MSRRSSTTIYAQVRLRLPPGVTAKATTEFLTQAVEEGVRTLSSDNPLKSLATKEILIKITKRETTYLS